MFRSCVHTVRELRTYAWGEGDSPVKKNDHCADALRYFLMTRPQAPRLPSVKTVIERDKERLAKAAMRRRGR